MCVEGGFGLCKCALGENLDCVNVWRIWIVQTQHYPACVCLHIHVCIQYMYVCVYIYTHIRDIVLGENIDCGGGEFGLCKCVLGENMDCVNVC